MKKALAVSLAVGGLFTGASALRMATAQAASSSAAASCTLSKGVYTCDWQVFRERFAAARSVTVQFQPMEPINRAAEKRLRDLVEALGKSVAPAEQPGDLTFRVAAADSAGIAIGPADQPLATLQVFARSADGSRPALLWVETFTGQADRPWPIIVSALADQFQARFRNGR